MQKQETDLVRFKSCHESRVQREGFVRIALGANTSLNQPHKHLFISCEDLADRDAGLARRRVTVKDG